ncbi:FAD-dependent oxidoreductase [Streptomyces sp. NPDC058534]|uniref:FAD-dependent oxidoreductase n=1 Tax=Streptomyces sp. NPDC058534 TaxID=3346541 RepID=UPI003650E4BE
MVPKPRIAVVGGGIGGLAAALALTRKGHEVRVFEQAPELRESGVGRHLGPNGSRVLERWGLGERLRALGVRPIGMEVRDWSHGTTLVRQPMGEEWLAEFGAPYYTIHRADLHTMLAESLRPARPPPGGRRRDGGQGPAPRPGRAHRNLNLRSCSLDTRPITTAHSVTSAHKKDCGRRL